MALVQSASDSQGAGTFNATATFASPTTPGNLLVLFWANRSRTTVPDTYPPAGWTHIGLTATTTSGAGVIVAAYKIADGTETSVTLGAGSQKRLVIAEHSGYGTLADFSTSMTTTKTTTYSATSVAPSATSVLLIAGFLGSNTLDNFVLSAGSGYTSTNEGDCHAETPRMLVEYQEVPATTSSATFGASASSNRVVAWASILLAFTGTPVAATPGVWIDWAKDGFDDGSAAVDARLVRMLPQSASVSDNATSDVLSFTCNRGASSDHVSAPAPGSCTITLRNEDGRYTPDNTASPLYGLLKPGRPVWIGRNADGTLSGTGQTVHGVWAGYVRQIAPMAAARISPTVDIICEDPLGYYSRQPASVGASTTRSVGELREAVLDAIGESSSRRDLASEPNTMQLSWADAESALDVLNDINTATGARHFIQPADRKEDWYFYTSVGRDYKLASATDFSLNADNIQATSGYRVTEENIVNYQVVSFDPSRFQSGRETVWTYDSLPRPISARERVVIRADFTDFVDEAGLVIADTNGLTSSAIVSYGNSADITITASTGGGVHAAGVIDTVTALSITGNAVLRADTLRLTAEDMTSEDNYGRRAGSTISGPYVGAAPLGQGVADFIVWKFAEPLKRPSVTVTNLLATVNGRTLFDTVALTIDGLSVAGRRFEIIGETVECSIAASASLISWTTNYELQETPNQSVLHLFTWGTSTWGGSDAFGA